MNTPKSFFSRFFLDFQDFLSKSIPEIKWIDIDNGQLDSAIRPALAYPAILIDFSADDVDELGSGSYYMAVTVHIYLITDNYAASYHKAPLKDRYNALAIYELEHRLITVLQSWIPDYCQGVVLQSSNSENRNDINLRVRHLQFSTSFEAYTE